MALIDKLEEQSDGSIRIPAHQFSDSITYWAEGIKTRADLVERYELDDTAGNDKEQLDLLRDYYLGLNATQKLLFADIFERGLRGLQSNELSRFEFATYVGLM